MNIGTIVNGYKVIKQLGEGSFGTVYLVKKNDIEYAMKSIEIDDNIKNIEHEIESLKIISTNDLCKTINSTGFCFIESFKSVSNNKPIYLIVTNYLKDSNTLQYIMDNNKALFTLNNVKIIMSKLINQLEVFNNLDIVHSDIKPDNIIIQYNNNQVINVLFIDFGLTCMQSNLDECGGGTPEYFAPELIPYNLTKTDCEDYKKKFKIPVTINDFKKTDIFSLGLIFYEMLFDK